MKKKWWFWAPVAIVGMIAFMALGGWVVMSLWNWLTPALFGWRLITFWQALGLLILCRILFGRMGGHGGHGWGRKRWEKRWEKMTPEEREKFRERMRGRCGMGPAEGGTQQTT